VAELGGMEEGAWGRANVLEGTYSPAYQDIYQWNNNIKRSSAGFDTAKIFWWPHNVIEVMLYSIL
jgi:hypothetical protein